VLIYLQNINQLHEEFFQDSILSWLCKPFDFSHYPPDITLRFAPGGGQQKSGEFAGIIQFYPLPITPGPKANTQRDNEWLQPVLPYAAYRVCRTSVNFCTKQCSLKISIASNSYYPTDLNHYHLCVYDNPATDHDVLFSRFFSLISEGFDQRLKSLRQN